MDCPDENTIARIQAGGASPLERAEFHEHVDQCSECMELVEILSRRDPGSTASPDTSSQSPVRGAREKGPREKRSSRPALAGQTNDLCVTTLTMTLTHVGCALLLTPAGVRHLGLCLRRRGSLAGLDALWLVSTASVALCLVVGPAVALLGLYGLRADRRWAEKVLRAYAAMAAATLLMAPLAACLVVLLRRARSFLRKT